MKKIRTILTGILLILTLSILLPAEIIMHRQMRQEQLQKKTRPIQGRMKMQML